MKKIFIIPCIYIYAFFFLTDKNEFGACFAQEHQLSSSQSVLEAIDSLKNALAYVKHDTTKVTLLNALSRHYCYISEYEKALEFVRKSIELSSEHKNLNLKSDEGYLLKRGLANAYCYAGIIYNSLSEFKLSIKFHFKALQIQKEIEDKKGIAATYHNIASIYDQRGDFDKAIELYFNALKINQEIQNKSWEANNLNNIGNIFNNKGDYDKAMEYYFMVLEIQKETKDNRGIAGSYQNIGNIYFEKRNYIKSIEFYIRSLRIGEKIGDKNGISNSYISIGNVYRENGEYEKSINHYLKALQVLEEIRDKQGMAAVYNNIGNLYFKINKITDSKKYQLLALNIAKEIGVKWDLSQIFLSLAQCDSAVADFKGAYKYHLLYSETKDSVFNEESNKRITEMQTRYETEKKEKEIQLLEKEGELQKLEVRRQEFIIWSVAGGLLIVLLFSLFVYKERSKSEKLLLNILPKETAKELKLKGKALPKHYKLVTVLFTDFKGFTKIAQKMSVEELVNELDFIFRKFDEIISRYPIEKIKTIGDAYMCAGGLPVANITNPMDVLRAALDIQQFVEEHKQQCIKEEKQYFEIRIGVHSGPVVAGVVGDKKFAYDIWGDTVNTASRMESSGEPGKVNISGSTYNFIKNDLHASDSRLQAAFRGKIPAKNKGEIEMFFVERV